MPTIYYFASLILAAIAAIAFEIVKNSVIQSKFLINVLKKLPLWANFLILLSIFLVFSLIANALISMQTLPSDPKARQTAISLTQNALIVQQSEIQTELTATARVEELGTPGSIADATGTAIAGQLTSLPVTQTEIAILSKNSIVAQVNPNLSVKSINVRSTPEIAKSNIVGWLVPEDLVVITGWTNHPAAWCRINIPKKNLHDVWVSYYAENQITLIMQDWNTLPPQLYFEYSGR